jgi:hypothetical protein
MSDIKYEILARIHRECIMVHGNRELLRVYAAQQYGS